MSISYNTLYILLEAILLNNSQGCQCRLIKKQEMSDRSIAPHGRGSRGPLKGAGGVQGQRPWWGSRGQRPLEAPGF